MTDLERTFLTRWLQLHGDIELIPQYPHKDDIHWRKIAPGRQFTWDFVHIESKVLVECQGGIYGRGAKRGSHIRPPGYHNDCVKMGMSTANGWVTIYITPRQLKDDPAMVTGWVADAIDMRLNGGVR